MGAEFRFTADPQPGWDGVVNCRVLEVEPEQRLRYTWVGGPLDTELALTLTPTARGTRLRVEHTGFEGFNAMLVSFILKAGSRRMYRKTLAHVLDAVAKGQTPDDEIAACNEKGFWRVLAAVFGPILKRTSPERKLRAQER